MFKRFFVMFMAVLTIMLSSTSVFAKATWYSDTPEGRMQRRNLSILQLEYDMTEALYEKEDYYDEKVTVKYDEDTNTYTLSASWSINRVDSVGMCYTFEDDDYEIGAIKRGYVYINNQLVATQYGEDETVWTEYGEQYKDYFDL